MAGTQELFIVVNIGYDQERIYKWVNGNLNYIPANWRVLAKDSFINLINDFQPYAYPQSEK